MDKIDGHNYKERICSLCGDIFFGMGHNPQPLRLNYEDRCCDVCNDTLVIPARIDRIYRRKTEAERR